jgi:cytochrome c-type biogenesis protein CcmH/NrfG
MPSSNKRPKNLNQKGAKTEPKKVAKQIDNFDTLRSRIQDLRDQYNFDAALKELHNVLKQAPNDVRILDLLGEVYVDNADPGNAVQVRFLTFFDNCRVSK